MQKEVYEKLLTEQEFYIEKEQPGNKFDRDGSFPCDDYKTYFKKRLLLMQIEYQRLLDRYEELKREL